MKQIDWRESKMLPPVTSCCFRANTNVSFLFPFHNIFYVISKHWCSFQEYLLDCFHFCCNESLFEQGIDMLDAGCKLGGQDPCGNTPSGLSGN